MCGLEQEVAIANGKKMRIAFEIADSVKHQNPASPGFFAASGLIGTSRSKPAYGHRIEDAEKREMRLTPNLVRVMRGSFE